MSMTAISGKTTTAIRETKQMAKMGVPGSGSILSKTEMLRTVSVTSDGISAGRNHK